MERNSKDQPELEYKADKKVHTLYTGYLALVGNTQTDVAATLTLAHLLREIFLTEIPIDEGQCAKIREEILSFPAAPLDRVEEEMPHSLGKSSGKFVLFQCPECKRERIVELSPGPTPACEDCEFLPMKLQSQFA